MPRKYSFLQVFWPAIVAGGTLTILLGIWTFNTFLPSEGESIPPDSLKIIWLWLVGGLLITAATIYFCHTRLRALSKSLEDLTGMIPELHASPISSHSIPPWFPEGDRLFRNLTSFGTNVQKELDLQRQKILEKETILSILMEGYVALDLKQTILDLNSAAAEMLQIDESTARNEFFGSLIRHVVLLDLVKKVLGCGKEIQDDIEIRTDERSLYLQVLCRPLIESGISEGIGLPPNSGSSPSTMEKQIGVLILLNDITQLQRLETVRRDFIANVSHELKTPITSIKGSVETLLQEEEMDGSTLNRFLKIIARHSDRLNSIIEDLLTLSRIEQGQLTGVEHLQVTSINQLIQQVIQVCEHSASEKGIKLEMNGDEILDAAVNPPLLEQALINLVENAIKYSDPKSLVTLSLEKQADQFIICVKDQGFGIEAMHLERIFERFYRIDVARSRKLGGTGLGLSIVKHIIQAHQGTVSVTSTPGEGSTFLIQIPFIEMNPI